MEEVDRTEVVVVREVEVMVVDTAVEEAMAEVAVVVTEAQVTAAVMVDSNEPWPIICRHPFYCHLHN